MEQILYILILILLDNYNFYKDINIVNSNNISILINKNNKLSSNYIPYDLEPISLEFSCKDKLLRHEAKIYFEEMAKKAKEDDMHIIAVSTYRSYEYQEKLYNNYVKKDGFYYAETCSARPGHSEHQTGLAVDIADLSLDYDNFEKTKEFIWMQKNSYKYGFILRYPKASFHITGFKYEPWHYRYVGIKIAKYIHDNNITLEEYKKRNL